MEKTVGCFPVATGLLCSPGKFPPAEQSFGCSSESLEPLDLSAMGHLGKQNLTGMVLLLFKNVHLSKDVILDKDRSDLELQKPLCQRERHQGCASGKETLLGNTSALS